MSRFGCLGERCSENLQVFCEPDSVSLGMLSGTGIARDRAGVCLVLCKTAKRLSNAVVLFSAPTKGSICCTSVPTHGATSLFHVQYSECLVVFPYGFH